MLVAVALLAGVASACISIAPPSEPTDNPAQLVDQLPAPADVADCTQLTSAARAFLHAAAAVAVAGRTDGPSADLSERLRVLGDGYDSRTSELACDEQPIIDEMRSLPRPSGEPSAVEILEYVLSGGELSYPTPNMDSLDNGVAP